MQVFLQSQLSCRSQPYQSRYGIWLTTRNQMNIGFLQFTRLPRTWFQLFNEKNPNSSYEALPKILVF